MLVSCAVSASTTASCMHMQLRLSEPMYGERMRQVEVIHAAGARACALAVLSVDWIACDSQCE